MTREGLLSFEGAAELRRSLRQLGQSETSPPRGAEAEKALEARMAASIDAEVSRLLASRGRARRLASAALAAAAVLGLGFGVRHWRGGASELAISRERFEAASAPASAGVAPQLPVDAVASGATQQPSSVRTMASSPSGAPSPTPPAASASAATPQSTLAEENQLFKEAAEASRSGDLNGALGRFEQLLRNYPQSPLAQTALVRKFRLMAKAGRSVEARGEAQRYLEAYPTGFAVSEAQALQRSGEPAMPGEEHAEP